MPRKIKICREIVLDEVFGFTWYLQFGGALGSAADWYSKRSGADKFVVIENALRLGHFATDTTAPKGGLIWFRDLDAPPQIIAHEAFHASCWVMRCLDCKLDDNSEEVQAYYIEYLVSALSKILEKKF